VPVFRLDERLVFPPPEYAEHGLLAVGGDLRPERLLLAYSMGIFPWYQRRQPILWHSPDPRMVLIPGAVKVSRSLHKTLMRKPFRLTLDTAFEAVIRACATVPRHGKRGTWITGDMHKAYVELHRRGYAHSVEAWKGRELVGGLYGVSLGAVFFGESMFSKVADASKVALVTLCRQLAAWGTNLVDCQVYTDHLARLGAVEWERPRFLGELRRALEVETRLGPWTFDGASAPGAEAPAGRRKLVE
jgi:leucyl/phenylalanyl-tRNA--protein transferase